MRFRCIPLFTNTVLLGDPIERARSVVRLVLALPACEQIGT